jgi:hypothetical protein
MNHAGNDAFYLNGLISPLRMDVCQQYGIVRDGVGPKTLAFHVLQNGRGALCRIGETTFGPCQAEGGQGDHVGDQGREFNVRGAQILHLFEELLNLFWGISSPTFGPGVHGDIE